MPNLRLLFFINKIKVEFVPVTTDKSVMQFFLAYVYEGLKMVDLIIYY